MGEFNPPVPQQDSNWEIRAAVVLSLLFQVLLIFLGPTRKRSSAPLFRLTLWSCYLLADWVADLALGLLLNNMGNGGGGGSMGATAGNNQPSSNPVIFAFWTPFLLFHLGGPDTITAYSVEDNELWNRHLIGLLFELLSASVIIYCSLQNNPLVPATVLMLVAGVIKYGERTYSLYSGRVKNLCSDPDPGPIVKVTVARREMDKLSLEARAYEFFLIFRRLPVDVILSWASKAFFLDSEQTPREAFEVIEVELNFIYDMVYTKAPVAYRRFGWILRCICSCCLVSALLIFFFLDKRGHQILLVDVGITYALLLGGLALDTVALLMIFFSNRAKVYLEESPRLRWLARLRQVTKQWQTRRWSGKTSLLNLIDYCAVMPGSYSSKGGRRWLYKAAEKLDVGDIVDDIIFIRRVPLCKQDGEDSPPVLKFIFDSVKSAAEKVKGKEDIMEMCNCRGNRVIQRHATEIKKAIGKMNGDISKMKAEVVEEKFKLILDSVVQSDFDESLLTWHVATDLCGAKDMERAGTADGAQLRPIAETLSEYMLYLLVKHPDMLPATAGTGLHRYRDTCEEARHFFFVFMEQWNPEHDHDDALRMLLRVDTSEKPSVVRTKSVLFDGVILAKLLRELDEKLMWEVITGVWGEMLTYAAAKVPGNMHIRQLSRGGELITLVWFLMAHMGLSMY